MKAKKKCILCGNVLDRHMDGREVCRSCEVAEVKSVTVEAYMVESDIDYSDEEHVVKIEIMEEPDLPAILITDLYIYVAGQEVKLPPIYLTTAYQLAVRERRS